LRIVSIRLSELCRSHNGGVHGQAGCFNATDTKTSKKEAAKNVRQFEGSHDRHNASHVTALWKLMEAFPTWPHACQKSQDRLACGEQEYRGSGFSAARG
jgi:hypothetical protein